MINSNFIIANSTLAKMNAEWINANINENWKSYIYPNVKCPCWKSEVIWTQSLVSSFSSSSFFGTAGYVEKKEFRKVAKCFPISHTFQHSRVWVKIVDLSWQILSFKLSSTVNDEYTMREMFLQEGKEIKQT